jgi:hypothetical protein
MLWDKSILLDWIEYDTTKEIPESCYQFAMIMTRLDALCGVKRPDHKKYLPKPVRKPKAKKTLEQMKAHMFARADLITETNERQDKGD